MRRPFLKVPIRTKKPSKSKQYLAYANLEKTRGLNEATRHRLGGRNIPFADGDTKKSQHACNAFVRFLNGRQKDLERNMTAVLVQSFDRSPGGASAPR